MLPISLMVSDGKGYFMSCYLTLLRGGFAVIVFSNVTRVRITTKDTTFFFLAQVL